MDICGVSNLVGVGGVTDRVDVDNDVDNGDDFRDEPP